MFMSEGSKSLQQGKLSQARRYFSQAVNAASSVLQLAEAFHVLALANLKLGRIRDYFDSEELAARYYAHIDSGQSADFLKHAGDILIRLGKCGAGAEAYRQASEYFNNQSSVEEDKALQLAWKGWSLFCHAKSGTAESSKSFRKAANLFVDAANASIDDAQKKHRTINAHVAFALSFLWDTNLELDRRVEKAKEHFEKAFIIETDNPQIRACYFCIESLIVLTKIDKHGPINVEQYRNLAKNINMVKEALKLMEYTSLLIREMDQTESSLQSEPVFSGKPNRLNKLLLKIVNAVC